MGITIQSTNASGNPADTYIHGKLPKTLPLNSGAHYYFYETADTTTDMTWEHKTK